MATYQAVINTVQREVIAPTGDYRLVVVMAVALADAVPPVAVQIWCEHLLPDYGPYWYRVQNDAYGNLKVSAGL